MIKTSDGKTYYGYWLDQNEREVALVDIVNNDVVTLPTDDVVDIVNNYPEKSLERAIGYSKYAGWKISSVANVGSILGRVALVDENGFFVSLGTKDGLQPNAELTLKGAGKRITDPDTGEDIGVIRPELAKLKVVDVLNDHLSRVSLVDVSKPVDIKRGMVVDWRRSDKKLAVLDIEWRSETEIATGNEALVLQSQLIDELISRGVTVVSKARLDLATLKLTKEWGLSADKLPALAIAESIAADIAVTGTLLPRSTYQADAALRVLDVAQGNYVAVVRGMVSRDKLKSTQPGMNKAGGDDGGTNFIGMRFVTIPAGTFMMGSEKGRPNERPVHEVTISKPFEMGIYEVTQDQYQTVMGKNPSEIKGGNHPVEWVSWRDAVEFCERLTNHPKSRAAGYVYRLPTEAEWEYACRAGTTTEYSFGDDALKLLDHGWFFSNSGTRRLAEGMVLPDLSNKGTLTDHNRNSTHPVGRLKPNAWGLYDMHGNVQEWCQDRFREYTADAMIDPQGGSEVPSRAMRGGGRTNLSGYCRSAWREWSAIQSGNLGFRVVRTKDNEP